MRSCRSRVRSLVGQVAVWPSRLASWTKGVGFGPEELLYVHFGVNDDDTRIDRAAVQATQDAKARHTAGLFAGRIKVGMNHQVCPEAIPLPPSS